MLSRGRPLNSQDPERVRAPDHQPKPRSGPSHPFRRSNGPCRPPAWFDSSIDSNGPSLRQPWSPPPFSARKRRRVCEGVMPLRPVVGFLRPRSRSRRTCSTRSECAPWCWRHGQGLPRDAARLKKMIFGRDDARRNRGGRELIALLDFSATATVHQ